MLKQQAPDVNSGCSGFAEELYRCFKPQIGKVSTGSNVAAKSFKVKMGELCWSSAALATMYTKSSSYSKIRLRRRHQQPGKKYAMA